MHSAGSRPLLGRNNPSRLASGRQPAARVAPGVETAVAAHPPIRSALRGRRIGAYPRSLALGLAMISIAAMGVTASSGPASASQAAHSRAKAPTGCGALGQARLEPSRRLPPRSLRGYTRVYCDDFLGRGLGRGWFLFRGQPGGDPGAMFEPSHVRLTGGLLTINTYRDRALDGGWATGGLCQCMVAQTYGAYYVRSRVTAGGDDNDELLWPAKPVWPPEIDFNETGPSTSWTGSYVHYDAANHQIAHQVAINLTRWHTWGVVWTPRSVTFTVDGRVWARVTAPAAIPHVPMTLDLQEQTFCYNGEACPTRPVALEIDWVAEFAPRG